MRLTWLSSLCDLNRTPTTLDETNWQCSSRDWTALVLLLQGAVSSAIHFFPSSSLLLAIDYITAGGKISSQKLKFYCINVFFCRLRRDPYQWGRLDKLQLSIKSLNVEDGKMMYTTPAMMVVMKPQVFRILMDLEAHKGVGEKLTTICLIWILLII